MARHSQSVLNMMDPGSSDSSCSGDRVRSGAVNPFLVRGRRCSGKRTCSVSSSIHGLRDERCSIADADSGGGRIPRMRREEGDPCIKNGAEDGPSSHPLCLLSLLLRRAAHPHFALLGRLLVTSDFFFIDCSKANTLEVIRFTIIGIRFSPFVIVLAASFGFNRRGALPHLHTRLNTNGSIWAHFGPNEHSMTMRNVRASPRLAMHTKISIN